MRIDGFRFRYLGPFGAEGIRVEGLVPGLNVIAEHNERGKSSLLRGLQLFLLQGHTSWGKRGHAVKREDGSTTGEIDFTHEGTAYRLIKTYQRGKDVQLIDRVSGAVLARKGEADERLAAIMGTADKARGPSGLLWIEQGESMTSIQDDGLVASKIESEMSTLVGGDRARDYLARTETALGDILTATGRPRVGGPLKTAEDALEAVEDALHAAEQRRDLTRQIGRDLERARTSLAALDHQDDQDMDAKIESADAALRKARAAQASVETAEAVSQRLQAEFERATERLEAHLSAVADYDNAQGGLSTETATIESAETRRETLQAQQTELDATLRDLRAAQAQLAERQAIETRREGLLQRLNALAEINMRLDALDGVLKERARQADARNAMPQIDRDRLDRMAALDTQCEDCLRALSSVEARLMLELEAGARAEIDGQPLPSGPVRLDATTALILPGVGRITLDAPEADTLRAELEQAQQQRQALFDDAGVPDYQAAAEAFRTRETLASELRALDREAARIAPDGRETLIERRQTLQQDITTIEDSLKEISEDEPQTDPDRLSADIAERSATKATNEDELRDIAGQIAAAQTRHDAHRRKLAELPPDVAPDLREAERTKRAAEAATAQARLEAAQARIAVLHAQGQDDPDMLEANLKRLVQVRDNRASEQDALKRTIVELQARRAGVLDRSDPDTDVAALSEQAEQLRETIQQHRQRAEALILLRDTLQASQRQLQDEYTSPVRRELAPLLSRVIDGADLSLSDSLGPQGLTRDGRDDTLDRLSGGTREQIAILTRLAFARLLSRGGQPCPVILDDALVHADDERRERMFDVLNHVSRGEDPLQLIYLSCHERAARDLGGNRLKLDIWPED